MQDFELVQRRREKGGVEFIARFDQRFVKNNPDPDSTKYEPLLWSPLFLVQQLTVLDSASHSRSTLSYGTTRSRSF